MLRHVHIATTLTFLSSGIVFAADNVPRLDVNKTCRDAYGALQADTATTSTVDKKASEADAQQTYKSCMESEDAARKSAAERWVRVKGENRQTCFGMASAIFPSYVELDACLQMYDDKDPQLTGETPAGAVPPPKR
jgi:hypothetical protein